MIRRLRYVKGHLVMILRRSVDIIGLVYWISICRVRLWCYERDRV